MDLKKELEKRNKFVRLESRKILNEFKDILDETIKSMSLNEFNIKWIAIDFHPTSDLFINVVGILKNDIGSIVETEHGETRMIDETNVNNYIKPVRLILPLNIIQNRDKEELAIFMEEYIGLTANVDPEEMEDMLRNNKFLEESFSLFKYNRKLLTDHRERIVHDDFDLTNLELDDIQLQFLKMGYPEGKT